MPTRLNDAGRARICAAVGIRTLLSALLALAVLLAPTVTSAAAARMAAPDHQMQMMQAGHCNSIPLQDREKSDGKTCCVSTSMGLAVAPAAPVSESSARPSPPVFRVRTIHLAHLGEIATPPPRHA